MDANLTFLLVCVCVIAAACLAIWLLKSTPARIVAVIMALAALVSALTQLISPLKEEPGSTVAPASGASVPAIYGTPAETPTSVPVASSTNTRLVPPTTTPSTGE